MSIIQIYKKRKIVIGIVSIFIALILAYISINIDNNKTNNLNKKYPNIRKIDFIDNYVLNSFYPKGGRFWSIKSYIVLDNNKKYQIEVLKQINIKYKKYFGEVIKEGVHLKKHIGSDTLVINNNEHTYYYIIDF